MKKYIIYTDGSQLDKQHHGRLGCGGVLLSGTGQKIDQLSEEITPEFMQKEYQTSDCSNPTMEMMGVLKALQNFNIESGSEVTIKADYLGVREWNTGNWKIKKSYIKKIYDQIQKIIKDKKLNINFEWVKGHQSMSIMDSDAYWNNYVDKLAKSTTHEL